MRVGFRRWLSGHQKFQNQETCGRRELLLSCLHAYLAPFLSITSLSFLSSHPSLALWGASPCLPGTCCHSAPVPTRDKVKDVQWKRDSLSVSILHNVLFKSGILWHRILLTILGWSPYLHTSQQRWRFISVLVALFWENCLQKNYKYCHKSILLGISRKTSSFLHIAVK